MLFVGGRLPTEMSAPTGIGFCRACESHMSAVSNTRRRRVYETPRSRGQSAQRPKTRTNDKCRPTPLRLTTMHLHMLPTSAAPVTISDLDLDLTAARAPGLPLPSRSPDRCHMSMQEPGKVS